MAANYVDVLTEGLYGPAVRCGLRDKTLREQELQLQDGLEFLREMDRELAIQSGKLDAVTAAGILAWSTVIVTDIIRNTVKVVPKGGTKIVMDVLDKVHKETSKRKFDGARYAEQIKHVQEAKKVLRELLPQGTKELADVFGDLAADSLGLAGFAEDAGDTRGTHDQAQRTARANVQRMAATLKKIQARIADDARTDESDAIEARSRRSTPASAPLQVGGLR